MRKKRQHKSGYSIQKNEQENLQKRTKDTEVRARVTFEERELFKKYCAAHKNSEGEPMTMSQMLRAIVRDCGRKYLEETENEEE